MKCWRIRELEARACPGRQEHQTLYRVFRINRFLIGYAGNLDEPLDKRRLVVIPSQTRNRFQGAGAEGLILDEDEEPLSGLQLVLFMDFVPEPRLWLPPLAILIREPAKPLEKVARRVDTRTI